MHTDNSMVSGNSLTLPKVSTSESADLQSAFDWLTLSGSRLLSEVAEKLRTNEEIDYAAVESHMLSSFHWSAVQRCIAILQLASGNITSQSNDANLGGGLRRGKISENSLIEVASGCGKLSPDFRELDHENQTVSGAGEGNEAEKEKFPDFILPDEATGHAFIDDFSAEDLTRLRTLAHLELAAQFEKCGLQPKYQPFAAAASLTTRSEQAPASPKSPRSKGRASGRCGGTSASGNHVSNSGSNGVSLDERWFGVSLDTVLAMERTKLRLQPGAVVEGHPVPQLVTAMITRLINIGLDEEGIMRVSGSHQNVHALKAQIDAHGPDNGVIESADVHDVSSLLKTFLRELPQPLLSGPYTDYYRQIDRLPNHHHRLIVISLLVLLLEPAACHTLRAVVNFLGRVLEHANKTRMTLRGLATVMTPSLLPTELTSTLGDSERVTSIIEMLIQYRKIAWRVPRTLVRHLRDSADTDCAIFCGFPSGGGRLEVRSSPKLTAAAPDRVRITYPGQEPQLVILESDATVASLLEGANLPEAQVYEAGGNVHRRRLSKTVKLSHLLAINPGLTLVVERVSQ